MTDATAIPDTFIGIGYNAHRSGLPLIPIQVPVPKPAPDEVLIRAIASSLNPLEYKLADLNFLGRTPPVILGFDISGIVVAVGTGVKSFRVGDAVAAMSAPSGDGCWAIPEGENAGYAVAKECMTVKKPPSLDYVEAAALPMCFLSAYKSIYDKVGADTSIYIPGGGGGVGHLAVQMAARALGARLVISSGSTPLSMSLAKNSGAHHVFDYNRDDVASEILKLTDGKGVDVVYDATYNETSFANTAKMVSQGGSWVVLGVGPGNTTRLAVTESPVDSILKARGAKHINFNLLRYFMDPTLLTEDAKADLSKGLKLCMEWAERGLIKPHVDLTIECSADAINDGLTSLKKGSGNLGKIGVILDSKRS